MPACIVFVHDDPGFAEPAVAALRAWEGTMLLRSMIRWQQSTPWSIPNASSY